MTGLLAPSRSAAGAAAPPGRTATRPDSRYRVLIVIDEPCTSLELGARVRAKSGHRPVEALVIAPAHGSAATQWYVDEEAERADATRRLRACVASLAGDAIHAHGRLGDPDPVEAIADALHVFPADEILIVTAPRAHSTWLREDVIDRARRSFQLPVEHVVVPRTHGAAALRAAPCARRSRLWKRFVGVAGRGLQLLWRYRLGWLAGHSLLVLTHVGRRTGNAYRTVLYVQRYDRQTHEATVVSVWGASQWLRNIRANPASRVEIGLQRYVPEQRFLSTDEIFEIEKRFRRRHRIIARGQAKLMGWPWPATDEQLLELSAQLRGVTFRPAPSPAQEGLSAPPTVT